MMNTITRTLAAILANTVFVWGGCAQHPDLNVLFTIPANWTSVLEKVSLFLSNIVATVLHSHDPNCDFFFQ